MREDRQIRGERQLDGISPSSLRAMRPMTFRAVSPGPLKPATRFVLAEPVSVDGRLGQLATHPWLEVPAQPPQPPRRLPPPRLRVPRPRSVWNILRSTASGRGQL